MALVQFSPTFGPSTIKIIYILSLGPNQSGFDDDALAWSLHEQNSYLISSKYQDIEKQHPSSRYEKANLFEERKYGFVQLFFANKKNFSRGWAIFIVVAIIIVMLPTAHDYNDGRPQIATTPY